MKSKQSQQRSGIILAAALAAISGMSMVRTASAQYPAGQNGHANDASNRIGSGGYNETRSNSGGGYTANNVAERDVNGGRYFQGRIGERDPRAFSGPHNANPSDILNRQSNTPTDVGTQGMSNPAQSYYGETRFTAPPAGALPLGFNGGYVGTTLNTPLSLSSSTNVAHDAEGLQTRTMDKDTLVINRQLNSPDYINLLSNPNFNQTGTLTTTLTPGLQTFATGQEIPNGPLFPQLPDRPSADDLSILRMRDELRQSVEPTDNGTQSTNPNGTKSNNQDQNAQQPTGLNQPLNQPLGRAFDAPPAVAVNQPLSAQLPDGRLSNTGNLPPNAERQWGLPAATEQSTLLATLQQRLEQSGEIGKALSGARPVTPQTPKSANAQKNIVAPPNPEQGPVPVSSLATGVKAKGLHDLLAGSEDLIRQGKFDSALQQYNQALRVAPNNPLPILGRAHAELAGGYYARAEMDLRAVFRNDPELLLAQFDLASLFPKERLAYVRKDLHDLADKDPKAERPWFLLAYLDYNTGDTATADKDLTEAEQRSGRSDWAVRLLRQHWALPSNPKPSPLTPPAATPPARTAAPAPAPAPATTPNPAPAPQLNK